MLQYEENVELKEKSTDRHKCFYPANLFDTLHDISLFESLTNESILCLISVPFFPYIVDRALTPLTQIVFIAHCFKKPLHHLLVGFQDLYLLP